MDARVKKLLKRWKQRGERDKDRLELAKKEFPQLSDEAQKRWQERVIKRLKRLQLRTEHPGQHLNQVRSEVSDSCGCPDSYFLLSQPKYVRRNGQVVDEHEHIRPREVPEPPKGSVARISAGRGAC